MYIFIYNFYIECPSPQIFIDIFCISFSSGYDRSLLFCSCQSCRANKVVERAS